MKGIRGKMPIRWDLKETSLKSAHSEEEHLQFLNKVHQERHQLGLALKFNKLDIISDNYYASENTKPEKF